MISRVEDTNRFNENIKCSILILNCILAVDVDKKALRLNPFLWSSYESLCNKGEFLAPEKVFDLEHLDNFSHCQGVNPLVNLVNSNLENRQERYQEQQEAGPQPAVPATPIQSAVPPTLNILQTPAQPQVPAQHIFSTPQPPSSTPQQPVSTPLHPFSTPQPPFSTPLPPLSTPLQPSSTPQQNLFATPQNVPALLVNDSTIGSCTPRQNLLETPLLYWNNVSVPMSGVGPQLSGISLLNLTGDSDLSKTGGGHMPPPLRLVYTII